jgi:hypothetical protein
MSYKFNPHPANVENMVSSYLFNAERLIKMSRSEPFKHILLESAIINEDRESLIAAVAKADNWPINKDMLIKKHHKAFANFTKQIDKIKEMNS